MNIQTFSFHPLLGMSNIDHFREDVFVVGTKAPIVAVADGVTILNRNEDGSYPLFEDGESGPFKVAKVFCKTAVSNLEEHYPNINLEVIRRGYVLANQKVGEENVRLLGIDIDDPEFGAESFAATTAVAVVVGSTLYYGFVHDCGIAVVSREGQLKLRTIPGPKRPDRKELTNPALKKQLERASNLREYRNLIRNNPDFVVGGNMYSHGVINGQEGVLAYLELGSFNLESGNIVVVFSDGFANYFKHSKFLEILALAKSQESLGSQLDNFTTRILKKGISSDNYKVLKEYGLERTLVRLVL